MVLHSSLVTRNLRNLSPLLNHGCAWLWKSVVVYLLALVVHGALSFRPLLTNHYMTIVNVVAATEWFQNSPSSPARSDIANTGRRNLFIA